MSDADSVNVALGDGVVVLRRSGKSTPVVANVLGTESDATGRITTIWLDRIVHKTGESAFSGWKVSGAVSSVLTAE